MKNFKLLSQGFTLIELMVTIAIIAILLLVGLPSFKETITRNKVDTEANNLFRDLSFTRSESIKRGTSISICPSSNSTSCSGDGAYNKGWIIFIDSNENGAVNSEEIIRVVEEVTDGISMAGTLTYLCYNSNGLMC